MPNCKVAFHIYCQSRDRLFLYMYQNQLDQTHTLHLIDLIMTDLTSPQAMSEKPGVERASALLVQKMFELEEAYR